MCDHAYEDAHNHVHVVVDEYDDGTTEAYERCYDCFEKTRRQQAEGASVAAVRLAMEQLLLGVLTGRTTLMDISKHPGHSEVRRLSFRADNDDRRPADHRYVLEVREPGDVEVDRQACVDAYALRVEQLVAEMPPDERFHLLEGLMLRFAAAASAAEKSQ